MLCSSWLHMHSALGAQLLVLIVQSHWCAIPNTYVTVMLAGYMTSILHCYVSSTLLAMALHIHCLACLPGHSCMQTVSNAQQQYWLLTFSMSMSSVSHSVPMRSCASSNLYHIIVRQRLPWLVTSTVFKIVHRSSAWGVTEELLHADGSTGIPAGDCE